MSKTFKKSSQIDDYDNGHHHYKYQKSKHFKDSYKNIDKYIRTQNFDKLEEMSEYEYPEYK